MKINYYTTFLSIVLFFATSLSLFAQLDENEKLVYKLIKQDNAKKLKKLMNQDMEFKNYVLTYYSKTEKTYLEQAIDDCSLKTVELLTKNKAIIGYTEEYSEEIVDIYIDELSCVFSSKKKKCLVAAYAQLVKNDYVRIRPTLLGRLNCYFDVVSEWYFDMQPIVKELIGKGLKVEESIINITEERENYLIELCKLEKQFTEEFTQKEIHDIRNYILFLKEQKVDFKTEINGKRPIDLLSKEFQKEVE